MKKIVFTFLLFFVFILNGFSQQKDYRDKFTQGNYLILEQNYSLALDYFLEAYQIDSSNANINYKIGLCYLQMPIGKTRALPYLKKAILNVGHKYNVDDPTEKKAPEMAYQLLGEAYRLEYKFAESSTAFKAFKDLVGSNNSEITKELDTQIEKNVTAVDFIHDSLPVTITNLGDSINTIYPEYSPVVSADESILIFTSRRPGSTGGLKTPEDEFYEDIYYSVKGEDGKWGKAKNMGSPINSNSNEANLSLSADGQLLFVYRDVNGGDIFYSSLEGDKFGELFPLNDINSPAWETHASLSPDGSTLYFVSNRKEGSYGGRDIWRCVKLPNGSWSLPSNLGPTINTAEDEDAPFIHTDGVTLFFSSTGHQNMGGFDIFKSTKQDDGSWSPPQNMQYPINTPDDDIFYMQSADGRHGYFSSVRNGGKGAKDIYEVTFTNLFVEPQSVVSGYMTFNGTKNIPPTARITATEVESNTLVQEVKPNSITGKYLFILNAGSNGKSYTINYEADGFKPLTVTIKIPAGASYKEIEKELSLKFINLESNAEGTTGEFKGAPNKGTAGLKELANSKSPTGLKGTSNLKGATGLFGTTDLKGTIKDTQGKLIPTALVVIRDYRTGRVTNTVSSADESGYVVALNRGQNYTISYEAPGYIFQSEVITAPKQSENSALTKNIVLEKITLGSKIVLKNLSFDPNKFALNTKSAPEIEKIVTFLTNNPHVKIEVSGHTDNTGDAAANLKLSQLRSQSVINELLKKGIDKKRLASKGYGQLQPVAPNTLPNGAPNQDGMQANRRVELLITSVN